MVITSNKICPFGTRKPSKTVVSFAVDAASGSLRFVHELSTAPYKPCNISPYSELA